MRRSHLGSLSGTVFGDTVPPIVVWWTITEGPDQYGPKRIVGGGGSSDPGELTHVRSRYPAPRYTVTGHSSEAAQSAYQDQVRKAASGGGIDALLRAFTSSPSKASGAPLITPKRVAIAAGIALGAYLLLRRK